MSDRPIKHGTPYAYRRHGCRCEDCRAAARAYDLLYWRRRGRMPKGNPCEKDGVVYPTQRVAAEALGVKRSAICAQLRRYGNLSRVGRGKGHSNGGRKIPVRIGPREWPSRVALAEYLSVTPDQLRGWIRRGDRQRLLAALMLADAREAGKMRRAA